MRDTCPTCKSRKIVHTWRTDMRTLTWIDDYKCLDCGEHIVSNTVPQKLPIQK